MRMVERGLWRLLIAVAIIAAIVTALDRASESTERVGPAAAPDPEPDFRFRDRGVLDMRYVCLVYGERGPPARSCTARDGCRFDAASIAYDRQLEESGHLIIAQALQTVTKIQEGAEAKGKGHRDRRPVCGNQGAAARILHDRSRHARRRCSNSPVAPRLAGFGTIEVRQVYNIPGILT